MLGALVVERASLFDDCFVVTIELIAIASALAAIPAAATAFGLNRLWPRSRFGVIGAPIVSAVIAIPAALLLLLMCGGQLELNETTGHIIWPPVASCVMVGVMVGIVTTSAIGLMRSGGRRA